MLVIVAIVTVLLNPVQCVLNKVKPNLCFNDKQHGNCSGSYESYYYDYGTAECKSFEYSGCHGNDNKFETLADCQRTCRNVCTLPKRVGPCKDYKKAYYFDTSEGKCTSFDYGGCKPNANNFLTMDDCRRQCPNVNPICLEKVERGHAIPPQHTVRYAFSKYSWSCVPFVYNGGGGNNNNFASQKECEKNCPLRDLCRFPAERGPCPWAHRRWHFDILSGQCVPFTYSGCLGNSNNFKTKDDCELRCAVKVSPTRTIKPQAGKDEPSHSICILPKAGEVSRSQEGGQDRFYYDTQRKSCRYFRYGGEGGNENNFRNIEECNLNCPVRSRCVEPLDRGNGRGERVQQWYYNLDSQTCLSFFYNGPGGNGNRFQTKTSCQELCIGCAESSSRGPCLGFQERYFYNKSTNACERFIYGGCGGTRNRFMDVGACEKRCK